MSDRVANTVLLLEFYNHVDEVARTAQAVEAYGYDENSKASRLQYVLLHSRAANASLGLLAFIQQNLANLPRDIALAMVNDLRARS